MMCINNKIVDADTQQVVERKRNKRFSKDRQQRLWQDPGQRLQTSAKAGPKYERL
jgi:hypothetical protein